MSSDIFIIPGWAGLSIQHAFAYGLPVIIPDRHDHGPEAILLTHKKTGYKYKNNDLDSLVDAIIELSRNDKLRKNIKYNSSLLLKNEYNTVSMASGFINSIESY
jgi:glycosyltransferase involved in cell wall biosynthesis